MEQNVFTIDNGDYGVLGKYTADTSIRRILVVCGASFDKLDISHYLTSLAKEKIMQIVRFSDFKPNPNYESAVAGVKFFRENSCDSILAIGGGSAMDVAKCIKLFATMPEGSDYIHEKIVPNDIPLMVIPTTAGTGSEATRYAVIYYKGEKQSITSTNCIPTAVFLDPDVLNSLPDYQRKVAMLDALCHAIESCWSVNSTDKSKELSKTAIRMIISAKDSYLANIPKGNRDMLLAANYAGKAINITQTTGGHAMSYKLTGLYGIAHGHAVALCVSVLWPYMIENFERCLDPRGKDYLFSTFEEIAQAMGCKKAIDAATFFNKILTSLHLGAPSINNEADFKILAKSVNTTRLKNNPVILDEITLENLYHKILER